MEALDHVPLIQGCQIARNPLRSHRYFLFHNNRYFNYSRTQIHSWPYKICFQSDRLLAHVEGWSSFQISLLSRGVSSPRTSWPTHNCPFTESHSKLLCFVQINRIMLVVASNITSPFSNCRGHMHHPIPPQAPFSWARATDVIATLICETSLSSCIFNVVKKSHFLTHS